MNFCIKCGKKLDGGHKFCVYCGQPVEVPDITTPVMPVPPPAPMPAPIPAPAPAPIYAPAPVPAPDPQPIIAPQPVVPKNKICNECGQELPSNATMCTLCSAPIY